MATCLVVTLWSVGAFAQTSVPNIFENGTQANADEVNENFAALADAIDNVPAGPAGPTGPAGLSNAYITNVQRVASPVPSAAVEAASITLPAGSYLIGASFTGEERLDAAQNFLEAVWYCGIMRSAAATLLEILDNSEGRILAAEVLNNNSDAWAVGTGVFPLTLGQTETAYLNCGRVSSDGDPGSYDRIINISLWAVQVAQLDVQ